jgi:nicotinate-nucleotide adenylyltransferase
MILRTPIVDGQRIGLFGGSFNPAHEGHLAVSLEALKRLDLDWIWWLVSPQNPLKDPTETGDFTERFARATALARHPRLLVLDVERQIASRTTAETFRALAPIFARGRFVWVMGADSFADLHRWNDWHDIPETLPLAVFDRPGWSLKALSSPAARIYRDRRLDDYDAACLPAAAAPAWSFIPMPLRHESSTALRKAANETIEP